MGQGKVWHPPTTIFDPKTKGMITTDEGVHTEAGFTPFAKRPIVPLYEEHPT